MNLKNGKKISGSAGFNLRTLFFIFILSFFLTPRTLWAEQPQDGEGGICLPCDDATNPCDDGNPCTDDKCIDLADGSTGCQFTPNNNNFCSDGNACTTPDQCVNGVCAGGAAKVCPDDGDGNPCTGVACDPTTGTCTAIFTNDPCDDGNLCTVGDQCAGGLCRGNPKVCDDQDPCTENSCNAQTGQCEFKLRAQAKCSKTQACAAGTNCDLATCLCAQDCNANKPLGPGGQCNPNCPAGQACDADCSCKACPGEGGVCTLNCPGGQCVIGADGKCVCRRNCSQGPKQPGELCQNDCPQGAVCDQNTCTCEQPCSAGKGAPPGGVQCKDDCPQGARCNAEQCKCERLCSGGPKQAGEQCIDDCPQGTLCDQNTCTCQQPCDANLGKPPQGVRCQPDCPAGQACNPLNCSCVPCPLKGRCTLNCPGGSTCVFKNGQCSCERRCAAGPKQEGETCRDDCPNKNLGVICDQNTCTCQQPCQANLGPPRAGVQCQPQCPEGQACNAKCGCVQCPDAGGGCPADFCPAGAVCKVENGQCQCERLCSQGPKQAGELCKNDCPQGAVCNQNTCVCEQSCVAGLGPPGVGVCKDDCPQGQACNQNCNCQPCPDNNGGCTLVCPGGACVIREGQCKCERLCNQGPMKAGEVCRPVCPNGALCDENTCTCQQLCDAQLPGPIGGAQCNDNCPQGQGCNGNCNCQQCPINDQCPANFCPAGTQCQIQDGKCVCEQPCAANIGQILAGAQCKDNCPQGAACNLNTCTCEQPCNANAGQIIQGAQCKPNCPAGQGCEGNTCTCKICPINGQCPADFCPQGSQCQIRNGQCVCEQLCTGNLGQVINGAQCNDNCPQGSACNLQTCTCQQRCDANLGQIVGGAQCLPNCPQGQGCEGNTCTCKQCPINGQCPANFCPQGTQCQIKNGQCVCEQLCTGNVGQVLNGAQCKDNCPQGAACNLNTCICEQSCKDNAGGIIQGAQCKPDCPQGQGCDGNTCTCKKCPIDGQCPADFCPQGTQCVINNGQCVCEQPCDANLGKVLNGAQCKDNCPKGSACNLNTCNCQQPCDANVGQVIQGAICKDNCPKDQGCDAACKCVKCPINGQCPANFCPQGTNCLIQNGQCQCERPCSKGPLQQGEICKDDCAQVVGGGAKCDPQTCTCQKPPCDQTAPQCGGDCPAPKECKAEAGGCQCKTPVLCTAGVAPGQGEFCKPDCPQNQKNKICDPNQCKCVECLVAGDCPNKACQIKNCQNNVCVYQPNPNVQCANPAGGCQIGGQNGVCNNQCQCIIPGQPGPGPGPGQPPFRPPRPAGGGPGGPGGGGPGGGGGGFPQRPAPGCPAGLMLVGISCDQANQNGLQWVPHPDQGRFPNIFWCCVAPPQPQQPQPQVQLTRCGEGMWQGFWCMPPARCVVPPCEMGFPDRACFGGWECCKCPGLGGGGPQVGGGGIPICPCEVGDPLKEGCIEGNNVIEDPAMCKAKGLKMTYVDENGNYLKVGKNVKREDKPQCRIFGRKVPPDPLPKWMVDDNPCLGEDVVCWGDQCENCFDCVDSPEREAAIKKVKELYKRDREIQKRMEQIRDKELPLLDKVGLGLAGVSNRPDVARSINKTLDKINKANEKLAANPDDEQAKKDLEDAEKSLDLDIMIATLGADDAARNKIKEYLKNAKPSAGPPPRTATENAFRQALLDNDKLKRELDDLDREQRQLNWAGKGKLPDAIAAVPCKDCIRLIISEKHNLCGPPLDDKGNFKEGRKDDQAREGEKCLVLDKEDKPTGQMGMCVRHLPGQEDHQGNKRKCCFLDCVGNIGPCPPEVIAAFADGVKNLPNNVVDIANRRGRFGRAGGEEEKEAWPERVVEWFGEKQAWAQQEGPVKIDVIEGELFILCDGQQIDHLMGGGPFQGNKFRIEWKGSNQEMMDKIKEILEEFIPPEQSKICNGRTGQECKIIFQCKGFICTQTVDAVMAALSAIPFGVEWAGQFLKQQFGCLDCPLNQEITWPCIGCGDGKVQRDIPKENPLREQCDPGDLAKTGRPSREDMETQCAQSAQFAELVQEDPKLNQCATGGCTCNYNCGCEVTPKCEMKVKDCDDKVVETIKDIPPSTTEQTVETYKSELCKKYETRCCEKTDPRSGFKVDSFEMKVQLMCQPENISTEEIPIKCPCPAHCSYKIRAVGKCFEDDVPVGYRQDAVNVEVTAEGDAEKCPAEVKLTTKVIKSIDSLVVERTPDPDPNFKVNNWENIQVKLGTTSPARRYAYGCVQLEAELPNQRPIGTVVPVVYVDTTRDEKPGKFELVGEKNFRLVKPCKVICEYAHACKVKEAEPFATDFVQTELVSIRTTGGSFRVIGAEEQVCDLPCPGGLITVERVGGFSESTKVSPTISSEECSPDKPIAVVMNCPDEKEKETVSCPNYLPRELEAKSTDLQSAEV